MIQLATLALPADLLWSDEYGHSPVLQSVRRRLDGGLRLDARPLISGRSITLTATEDAWLTRAQADALTALAASPGAVYPLSLRGQTFAVLFRHHDDPALDLRALVDWSDSSDDDPVVGHLKLITA
jgi:hypothetical protein